jgi:hypothetical protein
MTLGTVHIITDGKGGVSKGLDLWSVIYAIRLGTYGTNYSFPLIVLKGFFRRDAWFGDAAEARI